MTESSRPWWATDAQQLADALGPVEGVDDLDPIEAFRSARRPRPPEGGSAEATDDPGAGDEPRPHRPELCGICPLCTLARTLEDTRPELMGHLTEAARHLAAAARALLEPPPTAADGGGRADEPSAGAPATPRGGGVQRISLEKRSEGRTTAGPGGDG